MKIIEREIAEHSVQDLVRAGVNPLLARLYVARGVQSCDELDTSLSKLLPPSGLKGIHEAARILADAIAAQRSICRSFVLSPMATKRVSGISQRRESSSSAVPLLVPPGRISM